jgi:hypothetical protein
MTLRRPAMLVASAAVTVALASCSGGTGSTPGESTTSTTGSSSTGAPTTEHDMSRMQPGASMNH